MHNIYPDHLTHIVVRPVRYRGTKRLIVAEIPRAGWFEQSRANEIINEDHRVGTAVLPKAEALIIPDLVRLAMDLPDREEIRVVDVEGVDAQACGGTHVRSTIEVGGIRLIKSENKGKANRRVYFELVDGD